MSVKRSAGRSQISDISHLLSPFCREPYLIFFRTERIRDLNKAHLKLQPSQESLYGHTSQETSSLRYTTTQTAYFRKHGVDMGNAAVQLVAGLCCLWRAGGTFSNCMSCNLWRCRSPPLFCHFTFVGCLLFVPLCSDGAVWALSTNYSFYLWRVKQRRGGFYTGKGGYLGWEE
jgi:hypothetical protein